MSSHESSTPASPRPKADRPETKLTDTPGHDTIRRLTVLGRHALTAIGVGVATGLVIGAFRVSHDHIFPNLLGWLASYREHWWIVPVWLAVLAGVAWLLGKIIIAVPMTHGSGIPQMELVLSGRLKVAPSRWPGILAAKFAGSWLAVTAGLSLGREGPSILMGGAVGALAARLRGARNPGIHPAALAGAAAGLAAAFGAPVAGILFAFEEMRTRRSAVHIVSALCAAFSAQATIRLAFGLERMFPFQHFSPPPFLQNWPILVLGPLMGVLGVLYNVLLIRLKDAEAARTILPETLRTLPALWLGGVLAFTFPQVLGGGDSLVSALGDTAPAASWSALAVMLLPILLIKFGFSLISYMGGVSGGLLMPLLCIGAVLGRMAGDGLILAGVIEPAYAGSFLLAGMAAYFAAIVRAPLTGVALVIEMAGAPACLPGALVAACLADLTATALRCPPVYDSLRARIAIPGGEVRHRRHRRRSRSH